jgi:hypothetical protein
MVAERSDSAAARPNLHLHLCFRRDGDAKGDGTTYTGTFTAQWTPSGSTGDARVVLQATDKAGNRASREQSVRTVGLPPSPPF